MTKCYILSRSPAHSHLSVCVSPYPLALPRAGPYCVQYTPPYRRDTSRRHPRLRRFAVSFGVDHDSRASYPPYCTAPLSSVSLCRRVLMIKWSRERFRGRNNSRARYRAESILCLSSHHLLSTPSCGGGHLWHGWIGRLVHLHATLQARGSIRGSHQRDAIPAQIKHIKRPAS